MGPISTKQLTRKLLGLTLPFFAQAVSLPTSSKLTFQTGTSHSKSIMSIALPRVIGHRGAKSIAPENTLASIRAAKRVGAKFVEVDVMLSKDKVKGYPTSIIS